MAKTFQEVFDEIKANVCVSKKGKQVKSFSRTDFDKLAKAFLNDVNYKTDVAGTKEGKFVTTEVFPVAEFRKMLAVILKDFGVDKVAAADIADKYEIRNVDGLYEICSEIIYKYIEAGKKFDFMSKADFKGSLTLSEVAKATGIYRDIKSGAEISITKEAHKMLQRKSKCPAHLKSKADDKKKK
jgi:hypothetical protein